MRNMNERYMKLMKDVDENYKLIEQETQEHFIDFLDKWKAVARNKIEQYKVAFNKIGRASCRERVSSPV